MRPKHFFPLLCALCGLFASCKSVQESSHSYYNQHTKELQHIAQTYDTLNRIKPFSVGFTDRLYKYVTIEIITDTMKYSYDFALNENRLKDTLRKYGLDAARTFGLIDEMHEIRCRWVNTSAYYANEKPISYTFISIKPIWLNMPFTGKKYFMITYFSQPQRFDRHGRLRTNRSFRRITDKICYTFTESFRT